MRSTFSGLNAVNRGLYANQAGLDTVGHNISNASTEGYSRQLVNLVTTSPETTFGARGMMQIGTGVSVESITRARDTFVDRQFWKENSSLGYGQMTDDILSKIEGVFLEPSEYGLHSVLDNFWKSWQRLAGNASDDGVRATLRQRGVELKNAISHMDMQLRDLAADINAIVEIKVNTVNQITSEIFSLNKQITIVETGGNDHANDLRDRRDLLVDQLSTLMGVTVTEDKYGNYSVQSGSLTLVDGNHVTKLGIEATKDGSYGYEVFNVVYGGTMNGRFMEGGTALRFPEGNKGEIKGLIAMRGDLPGSNQEGVSDYLDKLATISKFLLTDFNGLHHEGYGLDNTQNDFFLTNDTPTTNAEWLKAFINSDIVDAAKIAAKSSSTQNNGNGEHAVLLANSLKTTPSAALDPISPTTLDAYYQAFIGKLGVQAKEAERLTKNQQTLVTQIKNWRESVAGVNMDEEMTNMIRFQKGYNAAARVITTIDEMLDKLINGTGVVGR